MEFNLCKHGDCASVIDSDGIEIGRVMVVRSDRKKMVSYLSELFGVS